MHRVITLSDSNYFDAGELFIKTRDRIDADFVLYGPDLTNAQIEKLEDHKINYIPCSSYKFKHYMQAMKFDLMTLQIEVDQNKKYDGFTLVDFDTLFVNDWGHVFKYNFDYGITIRNELVKKRLLRAYTNGGVVFAKHSAYDFLYYARQVINNGKDYHLPEYDEIWNTLEKGRAAHKTHLRTNHRWWVDQVFLSSLALHFFKKNGYHAIKSNPEFFKFHDTKIGLFDCGQYNVIDAEPVISNEKNIYIKHLKSSGRKKLVGTDKTVEKI